MIGNDIKIRKNKTTYLSKLLFLKNPIIPNGNRAKNIGKRHTGHATAKEHGLKMDPLWRSKSLLFHRKSLHSEVI